MHPRPAPLPSHPRNHWGHEPHAHPTAQLPVFQAKHDPVRCVWARGFRPWVPPTVPARLWPPSCSEAIWKGRSTGSY